MIDTEDSSARPLETDGDVDMMGEHTQEVEEPPPRLMITKMVRLIHGLHSKLLANVATTQCQVNSRFIDIQLASFYRFWKISSRTPGSKRLAPFINASLPLSGRMGRENRTLSTPCSLCLGNAPKSSVSTRSPNSSTRAMVSKTILRHRHGSPSTFRTLLIRAAATKTTVSYRIPK